MQEVNIRIQDVVEITQKPLDLAQWLLKKGVLSATERCEKCGCDLDGKLVTVTNRGKVSVCVRCSSCHRRHSVTHGSVFEGLKASLGKYIMILYLWSLRTPYNTIVAMTGVGNDLLTNFQLSLRKKMKTQVRGIRLGGIGDVIEIDETEYGKKRKGLHGHPSDIKLNLWGAVSRRTGLLVMRAFKKPSDSNPAENRFGPARASEVLPFVQQHVRVGATVLSDRLSAYRNNLQRMGYQWYGVDHGNGQFAFTLPNGINVHSNTIDGHWGQWKNVMRGMKSTKRRQLQYHAAEYCWRHNVINVGSVDPFNAFLQLCTDPCVDSDDSDDSTDDPMDAD